MKTTNRLLSLLLTLSLILGGLAGCANQTAPPTTEGAPTQQTQSGETSQQDVPSPAMEFDDWLSEWFDAYGYSVSVSSAESEQQYPPMVSFRNPEDLPADAATPVLLDAVLNSSSHCTDRLSVRYHYDDEKNFGYAMIELQAGYTEEEKKLFVNLSRDIAQKFDMYASEEALGLLWDKTFTLQSTTEDTEYYPVDTFQWYLSSYGDEYYNRGIAQLSTDGGKHRVIRYFNDESISYYVYAGVSPCTSAQYEAMQTKINAELKDANHPLDFSFVENPFAVVPVLTYTGEGKDVYTDHLSFDISMPHEDFPNSQIMCYPGFDPQVQDAAKSMAAAVWPFFSEELSSAQIDAFFKLAEYNPEETSIAANHIIENEFGARRNKYGDVVQKIGGFEFKCSSFATEYTEEFGVGYKVWPIQTEAVQPSKPLFWDVFFENLQNDAAEEYYIVTDNASNGIRLDVYDPLDRYSDFSVFVKLRALDNAVCGISTSFQSKRDEAERTWMRRFMAYLTANCFEDLTKEEALALYDNLIASNEVLHGTSYKEGQNSMTYQQFIFSELEQYTFEIELYPEELAADNNFFKDLGIWGNSVENGQFIDPIVGNPYQSGWEFPLYLNKFLEDSGEVISVNKYDYYHVYSLENGTPFTISGLRAGNIATLDAENNCFISVYDDNPHFIMLYREDNHADFGLDDGFYFEGMHEENMRQLPTALSLACDFDLLAQDAEALFSHSMDVTQTFDNVDVTLYCPQDVVHILVSDTAADSHEYYVMTKADYERTYGGSLDIFMANRTPALEYVKTAWSE